MRNLNFVLTIIVVVLFIAIFWKFFLVVILVILALLAWFFFKARKSISVFRKDSQQTAQEDIEERTYFPSDDVIDVEYQEKEID